jgi:hypothetical protein
MWTDPLEIAVALLKDAEAVAAGKACRVGTSDPELCEAAQQPFDRAMAKADRVTARLRRLGKARDASNPGGQWKAHRRAP